MKTQYWLEIWANLSNYRRICKVMNVEPGTEPRSLIKIASFEEKEYPNVDHFSYFLELLEKKYEKLHKLGVDRKDISIWMNTEYEDEKCTFSFDPMTLSLLGLEDIKPCISVWKSDEWGKKDPDKGLQTFRVVDIDEILIEPINHPLAVMTHSPGQAEITVAFDDGTFWVANFFTFQYVKFMHMLHQNEEASIKQPYFWAPNMILMNKITRKEVQNTVIQLLQNKTFEKAFTAIDTSDAIETEQSQIIADLTIIHDSEVSQSLNDAMGLKEHQIIQEPNFWTLHKVHDMDQPQVDYLSYFMDILEGKYEALARIGVQRQDIQINWQYQYEGHCNLEFRPEVLGRLGKKGIHLNITCKPAAKAVVRCLD